MWEQPEGTELVEDSVVLFGMGGALNWQVGRRACVPKKSSVTEEPQFKEYAQITQAFYLEVLGPPGQR